MNCASQTGLSNRFYQKQTTGGNDLNQKLKEKITELPEAVVLAQPLPRLLALTHKQLYKKYPAKKEYVRYYAPASYYKSVECKGHCVNLRHEYGLFI